MAKKIPAKKTRIDSSVCWGGPRNITMFFKKRGIA
jgi:hypothetical protein